MTQAPHQDQHAPYRAPPINPRGRAFDPDATDDERTYALLIHLSLLAHAVAMLFAFAIPVIMWQIKKDEYPIVDVHGKIVANWLISVFLYSLVCAVLTVVLIGTLGFLILGVLSVVFPIIGGIKANHGEAWPYPLSLKLIS